MTPKAYIRRICNTITVKLAHIDRYDLLIQQKPINAHPVSNQSSYMYAMFSFKDRNLMAQFTISVSFLLILGMAEP